jgi:Phage portal protein
MGKKRGKGGPVLTAVRAPSQARDLAQITDEMIATQESGYTRDPLALPAVYASVRLIASTINQLPVEASTGELPPWLRNPRRSGSALDLKDLVQFIVASMALQGAAYLRCTRVGAVQDKRGKWSGGDWRLDAYLPNLVRAVQEPLTNVVQLNYLIGTGMVGKPPVPAFQTEWANGEYVLHIPYLVTPEHPEGLSPIAAARQAVTGYTAVERQAATLLDNGTYSGGRLVTEQDITKSTAERFQSTWIENRAKGMLPVLGAGLKYENDLIDPADAQWLESRQYNSQQVAMMFGIPPDYLGMSMSGGSSSLSYANSQDNDRRFRRNCLAAFTQQISDAFSPMFGLGQELVFDYTRWEGEGAPETSGTDLADEGQ